MASILKVNELKDAGGNAIITSNGSGAVTYSGVDLNGTELVLDADADTSITADTDDQIDIKIAGTDRVHINSLGNVGIGTSSIDVSTQAGGSGYQVLQIENDEGGQINLDHTDAGTGSTLGMINFNRAGETVAHIGGVTDGATDSGQINFRTQAASGALTERMRITSAGKVGIGTNAPGDILEIDGTDPIFKVGNKIRIKADESNGTAFFGVGASINNLQFGDADFGTTALKIDFSANGAVTKPLQPAFNARQSSTQSNLDINGGAAITILMATEIFDQNADYNTSTSTFTAPVAGRYQLNFHTYMADVDDDFAYLQLDLVTSNRQYNIIMENSGEDGYDHFSIAVLADMDASDTALVKIQGSGGADQLDLSQSSFSGFLAC